jgi:metal transporter CNNM
MASVYRPDLYVDATHLREIPLNSVPTVPYDEPLLLTLDRFQQGNSHMAVVSRIPLRTESKAKPGSVNEEAKVGLTRRFLNRVRFGDDSSSSSDSSEDDADGAGSTSSSKNKRKRVKKHLDANGSDDAEKRDRDKSSKTTPSSPWKQWNRINALEQTMPSDAVLASEDADEVGCAPSF